MQRQENVKSRTKTPFGDIFYDRSLYFHGIGVDLVRLCSILEHGILSESEAARRGVPFAHNYWGEELFNWICVSESPSINGTFDSGSFEVFIRRGGFSFVIANCSANKPPLKSRRYRGFIDEAQVWREIKPEKLVGLMVPEPLLARQISALPLDLYKRGCSYIVPRCRATLQSLRLYFDYDADTAKLEPLFSQIEKTRREQPDYFTRCKGPNELVTSAQVEIQAMIAAAFESFYGKENLTLREALRLVAPPRMKIYNQDGFEINLD